MDPVIVVIPVCVDASTARSLLLTDHIVSPLLCWHNCVIGHIVYTVDSQVLFVQTC